MRREVVVKFGRRSDFRMCFFPPFHPKKKERNGGRDEYTVTKPYKGVPYIFYSFYSLFVQSGLPMSTVHHNR